MSKTARSPRSAKPASPHRAWRRHHVAAAALALLGSGGNAAPVNWVGADDGFWDVTGNWDTGQPGASADVQLLAFNTTLRSGSYGVRSLAGSGRLTLSGGALSFSEASTLGSMLLSGGSLGGSGTLLVSGASEWQRGALGGTGAATFSGGLAITGHDLHDILNKRLVLGGTSTWTNASTYYQGQIRMGGGAVIDNSGSFLDQTDSATSINANLGGAATFINSGTYTKTGAGTTTVQTAFNNDGTVNGTGLLVLSAGGSHTGNFAMDAGGTVQLNGGTHSFAGTHTTAGAGRLLLSNGATATAGGGSMSTQARWDLQGGTIGGAGTLALNGIANWTATTLSGGSHTRFGGALAIVGDGYRDVNAASVTFAGTTTWTNASTYYQGQIRTGNGSTLTNTGSFIDATVASTSINRDLGGAATFINSGTYQKTTGSTTTISAAFDNTPSGVIQLDAGTLVLAGGGNGGGQIDVASGATLAFAGGTHTLSGWTGGTGTGRVLVSAGTVNASGSNTLTGRVAISGGALNASGTLNTGGFDMSGGTLGGSGALALNLAANSTGAWVNGVIARSGTTTITGPLAISGDALHDVNGGRLVLAGTSTWTNGSTYYQGQFRLGSSAVIDNSGSFLDQTAVSTTINGSLAVGGGSFTNSGTYTKTGAGTTTLQVPFNNAGTVNGTGWLVLSAGGSHTGNFAMDAGGTVQLNGGTHSFAGQSTTGGLGRVLLSSGVVTVATSMSTTGRWDLEAGTVQGAGELAFDGVTNWSGGTQSEAGHTRFGGALALVGNGYRDVSQRTIAFAGNTTWTNSGSFYQGRLRTGNGALLVNSGNFFDQTVADTQIANDLGGAASSFANSGSYIKSGGSVVNIAIASTNTGTLRVSGGVLNLTGGLSNFAGSTLTGGSYEVFGPGILQFTGANVVTNAATVLLDGASSQLRNASNSANALASFAANTAAGRFTIQNGRHLTTLGAFNNEGWVQVGNASTFTAAGVFNNAAGATLQMAGGSLAGTTLPNAGSVSGFGNVAPAVANTGSVRATGGTLTLAGGVQGASGAVFIDTGATLDLGAPSSAGMLAHQGGLLALGANDITVHQDYDNASFGVGNSFDRRAAVSGSGLVLAAGSTQQVLTGALLQGGDTANATLVLPNIRVGQGGISTEFSIHNVGTGGPRLRGALQNTGISNAGLSGSGVTAQNWGALDQGGAGATFSVHFDPAFGQALSGQTLQVVNNFDNVAGQTLAITGSAYNLASASPAAPNPVVFANQREGGSLSQALSLSNIAPANGFSESLNASISGSGPVLASGSFSLLAAGGNNSTALVVGLDTRTAGAKAGVATIHLVSDGTGSSGFGALGIGTQTVNVSGSVYRLAQPVVDATPIVLAARVGDVAPQRSVAVSNSGADLYTERLNASWASAPAGWVAGGTVNGLGQGGSSQNLSLALATGASGSFAGTAQVALVSSGAGTTEAPDAALGQAAVPVTGRVYTPAVADVLTPVVNFGIVRVGDVVATRHVSLGNAAHGALNDSLHATLAGGAAPFAAGGSAEVAAGGLDETSLGVQLSTAQAGVFNSTATISLSSHNADLAELGLGESTVLLQAQVNQLAQAGLALAGGAASLAGGAAAYTLNFGTLALGGSAPGATLNLSNVTLGPADALAGCWDLAAVGPGSGFVLSGFDSFAGLAAGSSLGGLSVLFDSGSVGHFEQVVVLRSLSTNGAGPDLALGDVSLTLQGTVVAVPEPGTWLLMAGGLLLLARRKQGVCRQAAAQRLAA